MLLSNRQNPIRAEIRQMDGGSNASQPQRWTNLVILEQTVSMFRLFVVVFVFFYSGKTSSIIKKREKKIKKKKRTKSLNLNTSYHVLVSGAFICKY